MNQTRCVVEEGVCFRLIRAERTSPQKAIWVKKGKINKGVRGGGHLFWKNLYRKAAPKGGNFVRRAEEKDHIVMSVGRELGRWAAEDGSVGGGKKWSYRRRKVLSTRDGLLAGKLASSQTLQGGGASTIVFRDETQEGGT